MIEIVKKIIENIGSKLPQVISSISNCIYSVFTHLENRRVDKNEKKRQQQKQKSEDEIDDIADNGTLQDLLRKMTVMAFSILLVCGCVSDGSINITTTRQWEGHYMSENEFKKATQQIELQKNESIWVLSNETLKKILKGCKNEKN